MAVNRQTILSMLSAFKNPRIMKARYGITITENQIEAAERAIQSYNRMSDADLKRIDEKKALRWPYGITESQKYDKMMHSTNLNILQTLLWQRIKQYLVKHEDEKKTDPELICKALRDVEGFMQVNAYLGEFDENKDLITGQDVIPLMRLFNMAYSKYETLKNYGEKNA